MRTFALLSGAAIAVAILSAPVAAQAGPFDHGHHKKAKQYKTVKKSKWVWERQHVRRWYRHDVVEYNYDIDNVDTRDFGDALQGTGNTGGCAKAEDVNGQKVVICPDQTSAEYAPHSHPHG